MANLVQGVVGNHLGVTFIDVGWRRDVGFVNLFQVPIYHTIYSLCLCTFIYIIYIYILNQSCSTQYFISISNIISHIGISSGVKAELIQAISPALKYIQIMVTQLLRSWIYIYFISPLPHTGPSGIIKTQLSSDILHNPWQFKRCFFNIFPCRECVKDIKVKDEALNMADPVAAILVSVGWTKMVVSGVLV